MRISVFGLGYVGCITAACLADQGHQVFGVDVNAAKVRAIQEGLSPLVEPELAQLIRKGTASNRLQATLDTYHAVQATEVSLVCVGTPSRSNGGLDPQHVLRVCKQIGEALAIKDSYHVVVIRSTVLPDVLRDCVIELSRSSGWQIGAEYGFVTNPEFLREGSAVRDFHHPPFTLIGQMDQRAGDAVVHLYAHLHAPLIRTDPNTAMMVKYASNTFHALKVAFANEIGTLCDALGLDGQAVMRIFNQDTAQNISARYLKPGFAFGGSCLPKDLRAMLYLARHRDVSLPLLESILPSNQIQIQAALDRILEYPSRRVGLIGLSFRPNTDDLRESPMLQLAEALLGKGYALRIFDEVVDPDRLTGANRAFVENAIPHLSALMCSSVEEVFAACDIVVVAHAWHREVRNAIARLAPDRIVVDLRRTRWEAVHERPAATLAGDW